MGKQFQSVLLLVVIIVLSISGCSDEDTSTIGFPSSNSNVKLVYMDSFTVKLSTVSLDSIRTSGSGRILTGSFFNSQVGKITSTAYVDVAPGSWVPDETAVFDSIALIMTYDGYYYGDTLVSQKLVVSELSQNITGRSVRDPYLYNDIPYSYFYQEGSLYNSSVTPAYAGTLGSTKFTPRPLSKDSVHIRLKDQLGSAWLELAKRQSDSLATQSVFNGYFKGFKIATEGNASSVVGFKSSSMKVRLYYREVDANESVFTDKSVDFPIYNSTLQYNQLKVDRSGTSLSSLVPLKPLASELTNNVSFIQSGSGLLTKIEFPFLKKLYEKDPNIIVTQAVLEVTPMVDENTRENELPGTIGIFYTNQSNVPMGTLASDADASKAQTATLVAHGEYEKKATYTFPITNYVIKLLAKNSVSQYELLLGIPIGEFTNGITGMRVGNSANKVSTVRLKMYYSSYK